MSVNQCADTKIFFIIINDSQVSPFTTNAPCTTALPRSRYTSPYCLNYDKARQFEDFEF